MAPSDPTRALPRNLVTALVHPWTWRMAWRDSRAQRQRLVIFSLAIVAGIAAEWRAKPLAASNITNAAHVSMKHPPELFLN